MEYIAQQWSTEGDDIASQAIRLYQHSPATMPYTHVDAILEDGTLLGARLEGGVLVRNPGYAKFTFTRKVIIPCSAAQSALYYHYLLGQVGKPYDVEAILALALPIVPRDWREEDSWFCSELDMAAKVKAGIITDGILIEMNRVTPYMGLVISSILAND